MPLEKAEMPCIVLRKEEVWKKQMLSLLQELFSNLKTAEWNELSIRNQLSEIWLLMFLQLNSEQLAPKMVNGSAHSRKI